MGNPSAIEYLMTYGWMLLVVAIVGGAIFATVQDQEISQDFNETELEETIASQGGFQSCELTDDYNRQVDCISPVGELGNSTLEFSKSYDIKIEDERIVFSER